MGMAHRWATAGHTLGQVSMKARGGTTEETSKPMMRKMKLTLTLACHGQPGSQHLRAQLCRDSS